MFQQLRALLPKLQVIPWPKSMGWGAEQIGWIWRAYALAAEGLHDDDIVARQLREAAMKETDPELRERLWEEYRQYKKSTT